MRDFLWEGVEEGKRADLLNWEASCKLIYIGRLRLGALGLIIGCYWQNGYGVFPLSPLLFGLVVSDYHKQVYGPRSFSWISGWIKGTF